VRVTPGMVRRESERAIGSERAAGCNSAAYECMWRQTPQLSFAEKAPLWSLLAREV
jgi:hypothetical protein